MDLLANFLLHKTKVTNLCDMDHVDMKLTRRDFHYGGEGVSKRLE
jgi:hypothetical protein